jgi:hypothetical protein
LIGSAYTSGEPEASAVSSIAPIDSGSCCPSSSIVTIQSALVLDMPARVAACWPKFRASHTGRT